MQNHVLFPAQYDVAFFDSSRATYRICSEKFTYHHPAASTV
ncbi:hypothetical protein BN938_1929 [Mucinivorans hirudinis]|uniref:Uncharacterized protein n=1 Tax=Mucinivorans hirudinis TaxID=1433126 RepID=A0A060R905_9BACT|nr:hypothetical protein BN938_1929 [Mucinivorans hirudinis]